MVKCKRVSLEPLGLGSPGETAEVVEVTDNMVYLETSGFRSSYVVPHDRLEDLGVRPISRGANVQIGSGQARDLGLPNSGTYHIESLSSPPYTPSGGDVTLTRRSRIPVPRPQYEKVYGKKSRSSGEPRGSRSCHLHRRRTHEY
ncbi:MAG: hypothetical protein GF368_02215 [Candidatus Aenigmarchaeota archaeon]|nr:hypothetical protein [Candidatus Aenigmarchaeota archaeon]